MSKQEKINDDILRYITSDMDFAETECFEEKLKTDVALQSQVHEMRESLTLTHTWLTMEAPGMERLSRIDIPTLPRPGWNRFWRKAAVAAVFGFGFLSGSLTESRAPLWGSDGQPPTMAINTQPEITATPAPTGTPTPVPVPSPTVSAQERPRLAYNPPEYRREEDGKIIIETQLRNSGTQAIWVIDGQFRLEKENLQ